MAKVIGILNLLPGVYWNHDVVWQIRNAKTGEIKFSGTWDDAVKLPEDILSCEVDSYSTWPASYTETCKQIVYIPKEVKE